MKGHPLIYSAEELAWIKANCVRPRRETHAEFCVRFERSDVTIGAYKSLCKRNGWLTGRDGRYPSGSVPANKGKKMPFNANSARTQFKPGHRGGVALEKYKPIGTERLSKEGYVERKIHDGMPMQSRWRAVHILNWEEIHGQLPQGHCLKCLDDDKTNCDPSNWELIPRTMLPYLQGFRGIDYGAAEPEVKPAIMAIAKVRHKARASKVLPGSPEFHRQYDKRILAARDGNADCSGHVGSEADPKICARCGIHIDDLRPDDDHAPDWRL